MPYYSRQAKPDKWSFIGDAKRLLGNNLSRKRMINLVRALEGFNDNWEIANIDLIPFLEENLKSNSTMPVENLRVQKNHSYSYRVCFGKNAIFGDVPYQLVLYDNAGFCANLGFESYSSGGGMLISQMQGVPSRRALLAKLSWPRLLLSIAEQWAYSMDIPEISVLPISRNSWADVVSNKFGSKLIYDVTARRNGYKYNSETRVYTKIFGYSPLIGENFLAEKIE